MKQIASFSLGDLDLFEEGHTDEAYDAWRESQIHGGIWG